MQDVQACSSMVSVSFGVENCNPATPSPALRLCSLSQNRWCWLLFLQYDAFVCFHFQCPKHRKTHLSADFRTANVIALGSCTSQTLFLIECCSKCWLCTLERVEFKQQTVFRSKAKHLHCVLIRVPQVQGYCFKCRIKCYLQRAR